MLGVLAGALTAAQVMVTGTTSEGMSDSLGEAGRPVRLSLRAFSPLTLIYQRTWRRHFSASNGYYKTACAETSAGWILLRLQDWHAAAK